MTKPAAFSKSESDSEPASDSTSETGSESRKIFQEEDMAALYIILIVLLAVDIALDIVKFIRRK